MLEAMSAMLRQARSFDTLVDDLMAEIERQAKAAKSAAANRAVNRDSTQAKLNEVCQRINNIAAAMARNPNSEALDTHLRTLEAEQEILLSELGKPNLAQIKSLSRDEVAEFLSKKLENLHEVLSGTFTHAVIRYTSASASSS